MADRGRPRSFDRQAALEQAMFAFWEHGYEGTSIGDLTNAIGIAAPSLYAAFGDKQRLFEEAVECYRNGPGSFYADDLRQAPTARAAVELLLHKAAVSYTAPGRPRGCLIISATANHPADGAPIHTHLRHIGNETETNVRRRITEDIADGRLPPEADPTALAAFISTVIIGMSDRARDGATAEELTAIANTAMRAWPT